MHLGNCQFGQISEFVIERDRMPSTFLPVKKGPFVNTNTQHLFQTERLGAELHLITAVLFGPTSFVFDGGNPPVAVKFDDIGLTAQTETHGTNRQGPNSTDPALLTHLFAIGSFMQHPPFRRKTIFTPDLLQMNQGALPRAVLIVLQCG